MLDFIERTRGLRLPVIVKKELMVRSLLQMLVISTYHYTTVHNIMCEVLNSMGESENL